MSQSHLNLDIDAAINRIGDKDIYIEIARYFADTLESNLEKLASALEGAELGTANRLAHSLKGNCGTIGAEELCQGCRQLELLCRNGAAEEAKKLFSELRPKLLELRSTLHGL